MSKERLARIELVIPGWKAGVIPFHYGRKRVLDCLHNWRGSAAGVSVHSSLVIKGTTQWTQSFAKFAQIRWRIGSVPISCKFIAGQDTEPMCCSSVNVAPTRPTLFQTFDHDS